MEEDKRKLKRLITLVEAMRHQQTCYFRYKTVNYLIAARQAEELVDKYLAELRKPPVDPQRTLTFTDIQGGAPCTK